MTTPALTFRVIELDGHAPLDPHRTSLFGLWLHTMKHTPTVACDERWIRLGIAILTDAPLGSWVSGTESDPWDLPHDTPGLFIDELETLVEAEEGTDLQHLSWVDEGVNE